MHIGLAVHAEFHPESCKVFLDNVPSKILFFIIHLSDVMHKLWCQKNNNTDIQTLIQTLWNYQLLSLSSKKNVSNADPDPITSTIV